MTTTRSRSRGSGSAAPLTRTNFADADSVFFARVKQVKGKKFEAAQGSLMCKVNILRQKVEALRANVVPLFSGLVTRVDSLEQRYAQAQTAQIECNGQVKQLRRNVNSLVKTRTGTAHGVDLQFVRTAERL